MFPSFYCKMMIDVPVVRRASASESTLAAARLKLILALDCDLAAADDDVHLFSTSVIGRFR